MDGFVIVPPQRGDEFVELSRSRQGRVFRKQILKYEDLLYPGIKGGKVKIDEAFADALKKNFDAKVCDIVQVPKAGPNNEHTEDPDRNIGEVIGVVKATNGIYVDIDARSEEDANKLGKTLLGASAMMHLDYTDTRTGKHVGPTLLHVAVTNRPYVTDLEDFEELAMLSAPGADTTYRPVVLTAPNVKEEKMTLDDMLAELKADHGIDVPALQEKAAHADTAVALSAKIQEELVGTGLLKLSNGEEATSDLLIGAVAEAGNKIVELSGRLDTMAADAAKKDADNTVEGLARTGHILPKDKEAMKELFLSNKDLFDKLVPEKPVVKLSRGTEGELGFEKVDESHKETVDSEIARLTAVAKEKTSAYIRQ